jgi:very-short-patch-repair endonuclease
MVALAKKQTQINHKKIKPIGVKSTMGNSVVYSLKYKVKLNGKKVSRQMTVGTFIKDNPEGTFFVLVNHHAFTIKDGIIHGNYEDSTKKRKILKHAFKIII